MMTTPLGTPHRQRRHRPVEPTSWVYFAEVGPYVKVGFSRNPKRRVDRLFSSATNPPEGTPRDRASRRLLKVIPGGLSEERAMHAALADFCVGGEWFLNEDAVRRFIDDAQPGRHYPKVDRPGGEYVPPPRDAYDQALDMYAAMCAFGPQGDPLPTAAVWSLLVGAVKRGAAW